MHFYPNKYFWSSKPLPFEFLAQVFIDFKLNTLEQV